MDTTIEIAVLITAAISAVIFGWNTGKATVRNIRLRATADILASSLTNMIEASICGGDCRSCEFAGKHPNFCARENAINVLEKYQKGGQG